MLAHRERAAAAAELAEQRAASKVVAPERLFRLILGLEEKIDLRIALERQECVVAASGELVELIARLDPPGTARERPPFGRLHDLVGRGFRAAFPGIRRRRSRRQRGQHGRRKRFSHCLLRLFK